MGKNRIIISPIFSKLHFNEHPIVAQGEFQSQKGKGFLNHLICLFIRIPLTLKKEKFHLEICSKKGFSQWNRTFCSTKFRTLTRTKKDLFIEKKGLFTFYFQLVEENDCLNYTFSRCKILGISFPKRMSLQPQVKCIQIGDDKWTFDVEIHSPKGGIILRYWGEAQLS